MTETKLPYDWISVTDAAALVGVKNANQFRQWVWYWNRRDDVPKVIRVRGKVDRNTLMVAMRHRISMYVQPSQP